MKYNYLIITLFSFYMLPLYGQSNDYYSGKTEIISDQYSYKVKTNSLYVELRNIDNVLSESNWMQRDGITPMDYRASSFIKPSNPEAIYDIFRSLFNEDEIESLKQADGIVALNMAVEESGKILEVNFAFSNIPILTNVHPNTFHILCTKVKSNVEMNFPDFLKKWCSYAKNATFYIYLNKL